MQQYKISTSPIYKSLSLPFTFSHPAVTLPLARISPKWTSVTGLVIGSMTPDFEYFFRMMQTSTYSHTWPGMFWFDLPVGLALTLLFTGLVKTELIDHLPGFLNRRFSDYRHTQRNPGIGRNIVVLMISLLIGIFSHLCWDKITHRSVRLVDEEMELYNAYWELNSLIGAVIIASVVWKMPEGTLTKRKNILLFWVVVFVVSMAVVYLRYLFTSSIRSLGTAAISGFFIGLILMSLVGRFREN